MSGTQANASERSTMTPTEIEKLKELIAKLERAVVHERATASARPYWLAGRVDGFITEARALLSKQDSVERP